MPLAHTQRKRIVLSLIVIVMLLAIGRALLSSKPELEAKATALMQVVVRDQSAIEINREISFSGRTEPARRVAISPQTSGLISQIGAERGDFVHKGELLIAIDLQDRKQQLTEAEALVAQRNIEFSAAQDLHAKYLLSDNQLAAAKSALEIAKSRQAAIETDIKHTQIRAPFNGFLADRFVEIGHNLIANNFFNDQGIASFIEMDPLIIIGSISESEIGFIKKGMTAFATLANQNTIEGIVRYISPSADPDSRTFKIEIEFRNPDYAIAAGITAHVSIPGPLVWAHPISPDLLSLSQDGTFGIKAVNDNNRVVFYPAAWVKASQNTVWLEGLPRNIRLITIGQGFAQEGEQVVPHQEKGTAPEEQE